MSRAFGLVRFKTTGNIYYGCYNGTSDIMLPFLCTPEECYDEKLDCYCAIIYCQELRKKRGSWDFPSDVTDLDEVEIYSDYGGGFYWPGSGSESARMLDTHLNPWEEVYDEVKDGRPDWVMDFLEELEDI